jgi:hypothetical protein
MELDDLAHYRRLCVAHPHRLNLECIRYNLNPARYLSLQALQMRLFHLTLHT